MAKSPNALELLRRDHREVLGLLRQFERSDDERQQRELCREIVADLDAHAALEEDVFYPYVRETTDRLDLIEEATIEHDSAKELMDELRRADADTPRFHALMKVLGEYVALHVREEEERIFPLVEKLGIDLRALGEELAEHHDGNGHAAHGRQAATRRSERTHAKADGGSHREHRPAGEHPARAQRHEPARHGARAKGGHGEEHASDTTRDDKRFLEEHGDELSKSTQHAKWIHSTGEHAEHDGQTLATRNVDVIRAWAEARGGQPATSPGGDAENPRVLRFDFPGYDKNLQPVSWDAWFKVFQDRDLVFLYQEKMKAGNQSNFFRLDSPEREDG